LPAARCSNVASAFRAFLDHAKQQGIDTDHPLVRAATAALEELERYAANRGACGSPALLREASWLSPAPAQAGKERV